MRLLGCACTMIGLESLFRLCLKTGATRCLYVRISLAGWWIASMFADT